MPRLKSKKALIALLLLCSAIGLGIGLRQAASNGSRNIAAVGIPTGWADESSCIDCHAQAEEFEKTGHARTLRGASDQVSLDLLNKLMSEGKHGITELVPDESSVKVFRDDDHAKQYVQLDWCFGSGTHAHTWAGLLTDSRNTTDLLEFRYSWFQQIHGFERTPGQPVSPGEGAVSSFGLLFDGPKAARCLSCHATHVPVENGEIHSAGIIPGVNCQRCHGPRAAHVVSDGELHPEGWRIKDRMDSVRRCAVCHRVAEEREPHEIRPDNPDIVRFQPMGLMRSRCFTESEMTCVTCHNPHKPMASQDSKGIWQCLQCHNPIENPSHSGCAAGMSDNCLDCHMPKVRMEFPIHFTDHWIRVREENQ